MSLSAFCMEYKARVKELETKIAEQEEKLNEAAELLKETKWTHDWKRRRYELLTWIKEVNHG